MSPRGHVSVHCFSLEQPLPPASFHGSEEIFINHDTVSRQKVLTLSKGKSNIVELPAS